MQARRWFASSWGSILLTLLALAMLLWSYWTGQHLGMANGLSKLSWARAQYSTAVAVSRMDYGAPGYLVFTSVWRLLYEGGFRDAGSGLPIDPERAIERVRGQPIDREGLVDSPVYLRDWGDDKGNADYFMLAFSIFGFSISSLYKLYFLILTVSTLLFCAQFFRQIQWLIFAPLVLSAHHVALITVPDSLVTSVIHDAHFVPALAILASLHLAIMLIRPERGGPWTIPGVLVQLAIVVLVIDSRPSGIWLVYFPIAAYVLSLVGLAWNRGGRTMLVGRVVNRGALAALLLLAPLALSTYHRLGYDRAYTDDGIESHMVWHALYMGLSVHPDARSFGLNYTDTSSYQAVLSYFLAHAELQEALPPRDPATPARSPSTGVWGLADIGFRAYEQVGRAAFLSFVRDHPRYVAESFLLYKPKYLLDQLLWQTGWTDTWPAWVDTESAHQPFRRDLLNPFSLPAAAVVMAASAIAFAQAGSAARRRGVGLAALLFAASLLPSILVAPIYYELQVVFVTVVLLGYAVAASALMMTFEAVLKLGSTRVPTDGRRLQVAGLAGGVVGLVLVVAQAPSFATPGAAAQVNMPTHYPIELATDSLGQIFLLTPDRSDRVLPDWETYQQLVDDPSVPRSRQLADHEIDGWKWAGMAESVMDRAGEPQTLPRPRGPTPGLGITIGPVPIADDARNLAKGRRATQSNGSRIAARAVDGDTADESSAMLTDQAPGLWWQVDLGSQQWISSVQVWSRTDPCCRDRLHNILVFVSDSEPSSDDPYLLRVQPDVSNYFVLGRIGTPTTLPIGRPGRYIRIQKMAAGYLDIAEVKVWGLDSEKGTGRR
jgi:hypothetical protein